MNDTLRINIQRLRDKLLELSRVGNAGRRGFTRLAYSAEEKAAAKWLIAQLDGMGIRPVQDRVGNVSGKWGPADRPAAAVGSHLDTVPEGGLLDGALGVAAGLECLATLKDAGYEPAVPLELIGFIGEEANALGGTFGSRAAAGLLTPSADFTARLNARGLTWEDVEAARRRPDEFRSYVELHIEQGPLLEAEKQSVGVVTAVAGILRLAVEVRGVASHAGATPMHLRRDALVDAARLTQQVYEMARAAAGKVVATVGEIAIFPNLANVVPGRARLTIEIRGQSWADMQDLAARLQRWAAAGMDASFEVVVEKQPCKMDETIQEQIGAACRTLGVQPFYMPSGANHDANSMHVLTSAGMIFVPSINGLSHHPDESTDWADIEMGANVLLQTLLALSKRDA